MLRGIALLLPEVKSRMVRVEKSGELVRARAERYSTIKCNLDKNYAMLIGRDSAGLYVVEEYIETPRQSVC